MYTKMRLVEFEQHTGYETINGWPRSVWEKRYEVVFKFDTEQERDDFVAEIKRQLTNDSQLP